MFLDEMILTIYSILLIMIILIIILRLIYRRRKKFPLTSLPSPTKVKEGLKFFVEPKPSREDDVIIAAAVAAYLSAEKVSRKVLPIHFEKEKVSLNLWNLMGKLELMGGKPLKEGEKFWW